MNRPKPCLRCGARLDREMTGRPRVYCSDACRQAGNRLRRRLGADWWRLQGWYPEWLVGCERREAEAVREREERMREVEARRHKAEEEATRERELLASMPPDVRAGAEAARLARMRRGTWQIQLATLKLEIENLNTRYADALAGEHLAAEVVPVSQGKVMRLLWAAVTTDSEAEAAAMLSKARALVAAGDAPGVPAAQLSAGELLRRFLGAAV